jgi:hypothetical protein
MHNRCIKLPDSVINRINKPIQRDYIISVYRTHYYERDNTAVPVYNYLIKKPVTDKIISCRYKKANICFLLEMNITNQFPQAKWEMIINISKYMPRSTQALPAFD